MNSIMNRCLGSMLLCTAFLGTIGFADAQQTTSATLSVNAETALSSFQSLSDAHLRGILNALKVLAVTREARSANWSQIETPLRTLSDNLDTPATLYFANRAGDYWTAAGGRQTTIADRPYFARLLKGETVVGDMVVSHSVHQPAAVVAVPIFNGGTVVGILGATVDLRQLSAVLKNEMALTPNVVFFSLDPSGVIGISTDSSYIMLEAKDIVPEMQSTIAHALNADNGTVTYTTHGVRHTVIYRKSSFTGWRYAFGLIRS